MLTKGGAIFRRVSLKTWRSSRAGGGGGCGGDGGVISGLLIPNLKRKASNSVSAVKDTYLSTKQVFENHRVVFTVGTSIASVLTAWAGYSIRQLHQKNIEKRLDSIEASMKSNHSVEHEEIRKIVASGNVSTPSCIATALTTLIIGYALGWRGGSWFSNRKFRREQLKLMGQMKPNRWRFLKRPFVRLRNTGIVKNATPEVSPSTNAAASLPSNQIPSTS